MSQEDVEYRSYIVSLLLQYYGDVLKVSRSRGVNKPLPQLRKYIAADPKLTKAYHEAVTAEQIGQGLGNNAKLTTFIEAQVSGLEEGIATNNTMYAAEIKKVISVSTNKVSAKKKAEDKAKAKASLNRDFVNEIVKRPLSVDIDLITEEIADAVREILLSSFEIFGKWQFQIQMGFPFQEQDYHKVMFEFCQEIVDGRIDRGIVTIPPRHTKTQMLSISLPLYSFCINPHSHNIITSYADDVVAESSGYIRSTMLDPLFMIIFPSVRIDAAKRSLERWGTTKMGVMNAVPTGGKLTGKGAGSLSTLYSGVFVVDDAIKPKDAYSPTIRNDINERYDNTFMSRLANDGEVQDEDGNVVKCSRTPIVTIMQRVHDEDLVGYLLRGNSSDKYHWLNIPAIIDQGITGTQEFYDRIIARHEYTHAIPYVYELDRDEAQTALWPARKSFDSLVAMRKANPYIFNAQYMGDPSARGIGLIQEAWWVEYSDLPKHEVVRTFMTADTASTKETYSDFSVICFWAYCKDGYLYLVDCIVGKFEVPELSIAIQKFWKKHNRLDIQFPQMMPTALYMEDKSSGQYLNQQFMRDGSITCLPVPRDRSGKDKVARFLSTVKYFAQGKILFPAGHKHLPHIMREVLGYTGEGSGTNNDDVADNIADACDVAFNRPSANYDSWM